MDLSYSDFIKRLVTDKPSASKNRIRYVPESNLLILILNDAEVISVVYITLPIRSKICSDVISLVSILINVI